MSNIINTKYNFFINTKVDVYTLALFVAVSFNFLGTNIFILPIVLFLTTIQFFRLKKGMVSEKCFFYNYFYLLIYSSIFSNEVNKIILLSLLLFFLFFKKKQKRINSKVEKYYPEKLVLILFGLIVLSTVIFKPYLKGIDIYLYYLLIPLLFICIKKNGFNFSIIKSIKCFITSILVSIIILLVINLFLNKLTLSINPFFSKYLNLTHVYYGMFVGSANILLLILFLNKEKYLSYTIDFFIFLCFLIILTYIGARMSLIANIVIVIIITFKKISISFYKKILLLGLSVFTLFFLFTKTARFTKGTKQIMTIYKSSIKNDKEEIIKNSWLNMYRRYLVTKYTINEFKQHYLLGIGIQNVTTKISSKIKNDGYIHFYPINSHNQFLHFMIGLGIFGFLFFIYLLFYFIKETPNHSVLFIIFFIIIMSTESILVRGKGMSLFFLFTLSFLMNKTLNTLND